MNFPKVRIASSLAALTLAATVGGCASGPAFLGGTSRNVSFTNVASTPLNVTFYVKADEMADTDAPTNTDTHDGGTFTRAKSFQLDRGETAKFSVARRATEGTNAGASVHVQVEAVSPSWQPVSDAYWLEILTNPPVSIVATGPSDKLTFDTGDGAVAVIPKREIDSGRFEHQVDATPSSD
jgi:hypothetical protein